MVARLRWAGAHNKRLFYYSKYSKVRRLKTDWLVVDWPAPGFDGYSDSVCAEDVPLRATAAGGQSSSVYMSIISEQTFTGCWELNTELSNLLHVSLDELQKSAPVKVHYLLLSLFFFLFLWYYPCTLQ